MDKIVRATAGGAQVRVFVAYTKDMVEEARRRHNTSPVCTAALGRLLTAGSIMGSMLKGDNDILTLRINSSGPIGGITVTADSKGYVKGYVGNPDVILPANSIGKLDVAGIAPVPLFNVVQRCHGAQKRRRARAVRALHRADAVDPFSMNFIHRLSSSSHASSCERMPPERSAS